MGWAGWALLIGFAGFVLYVHLRRSARRANANQWTIFLEEVPEDSRLRPALQPFFLADGISQRLFLANYQAMTVFGAVEPAPVQPTPSARALMRGTNIPDSYPGWFVAAYPDVVHWLASMSLDDNVSAAKVMAIVGGEHFAKLAKEEGMEAATEWMEKSCYDSDGNFMPDSLRRMVDYYRVLTKRRLECAV